jgi:hypothetical protein
MKREMLKPHYHERSYISRVEKKPLGNSSHCAFDAIRQKRITFAAKIWIVYD